MLAELLKNATRFMLQA